MEVKDPYWPSPSHCAQVVTPLSFFPRAVPLVSREIPLFGPNGSDTPGGPPVGAGLVGGRKESVVEGGWDGGVEPKR